VTIIASTPAAAPGRVDRVSTVLTGSRAAALARVFRIVAIAEACSWIGLLIGMAFKYLVVFDDVGVRVFGPIHGALFVAYVVVTLVTARTFRWGAGTTLLALAASIPPAMTLWFERRAVRAGSLRA
jgi:integral membrane protein